MTLSCEDRYVLCRGGHFQHAFDDLISRASAMLGRLHNTRHWIPILFSSAADAVQLQTLKFFQHLKVTRKAYSKLVSRAAEVLIIASFPGNIVCQMTNNNDGLAAFVG